MLKLECFKAGKGDSFLLTWGEMQENNLLIDAGIEGTYRFIRLRLTSEAKLDAILITHVDYDHIGGFFKLLGDPDCQLDKSLKVFLNTPSLILASSNSDLVSIDHGVKFEQILYDKEIVPVPLFLGMNRENKVLLNGLELQILSPTQQVIDELLKQWTAFEIYQQYQIANQQQNNKVSAAEKALVSAKDILAKPPKPNEWEKDLLNASSIAFIAGHNGNKILFLGDSNPTIIVNELDRLGFTRDNQLIVDLVKISHHGSKHNTTKELLERISCNQYLISTDSSGPSYHPAREALILISEYGRKDKNVMLYIYTNYEIDLEPLLTAEEQKDLKLFFQEIAYLDFPNK
jgi:beta-lactamase superfamily II metal-dependent hydrolase